MNTLEVLTLLLVVFAALSYLDNHKKIASQPLKVRCYLLNSLFFTEGNRKINSDQPF